MCQVRGGVVGPYASAFHEFGEHEGEVIGEVFAPASPVAVVEKLTAGHARDPEVSTSGKNGEVGDEFGEPLGLIFEGPGGVDQGEVALDNSGDGVVPGL